MCDGVSWVPVGALEEAAMVEQERQKLVSGALSALGEAWTAVEGARQHVYEYHRLSGAGDASLMRAAHLLRAAGQDDLADAVCRQLVSHGVAGDRWSFEVDETHEDEFVHSLVRLQDHLRGWLPRESSSAQPIPGR